jgi:hypothetical protein
LTPLGIGSAFDPLEDGVRQRVRAFIETILEDELRAVLGRGRYKRSGEGASGHRNGHPPCDSSLLCDAVRTRSAADVGMPGLASMKKGLVGPSVTIIRP